MNQCILMAEVVQPPQLRYTQDNQTAVAEMVIEFPGLRPEDPTTTLKAVGWGNLAQEIQSRCQLGDRYVFEGRLRISTIDRPEGFKEKQAELTLSKIHNLSGEEYQSTETAAPDAARSSAPRSIQSAPRAVQAATQAAASGSATNSPTRSAPAAGAAKAEPDYDDIPF